MMDAEFPSVSCVTIAEGFCPPSSMSIVPPVRERDDDCVAGSLGVWEVLVLA